jgi:N-acetyl-gamma-glutamyl-phosphate reductase
MLNCAIIGATGYTGIELIKILLRHSQVRITGLTTRQEENIPIHRLIPTLPKNIDLEVRPYSFTEIKRNADLIFLCLPHTEAMETAAQFREAKKIVIDLSADFRLRDPQDYEAWYGVPHKNKELLKEAVYGLPERNREKISKADLIANPGCYPTGSILGIAPLLSAKLIEADSIIIDAKSGVSGAGKKLNAATQFCEVDENFYAYKVGKHQHTPEISQALSDAAGSKVNPVFTPHLLPLDRGILSTIYLKRKKDVKPEQISEAFHDAYDKELFVRVKKEGGFPSLKDVRDTNFCDIGFWVDSKSNQIIVITAIDNLIKGASGQAVQNLNVRSGFPEDEGLRAW